MVSGRSVKGKDHQRGENRGRHVSAPTSLRLCQSPFSEELVRHSYASFPYAGANLSSTVYLLTFSQYEYSQVVTEEVWGDMNRAVWRLEPPVVHEPTEHIAEPCESPQRQLTVPVANTP